MNTIWNYDMEKTWEYENGFYLTSHPSRLAKSIVHWELYKKILSLPGEIVECGVFKGASMVRFATYRDMAESPYSRKIIGFDAFGEFPPSSLPEDKEFIDHFQDMSGTGIPEDELAKCLKAKNIDNFELVGGDVCETIPEYISRNRELKIALLHVDVDVYDPTKVILDHLLGHMVPGGLIVFDDYGTVYGETRAIDEFLEQHGGKYPLKKLPYYKTAAFIEIR